MSGFGNQAFGGSPYGLGTPTPAPANGGGLLADLRTGESRGSRAIDAQSRDYVLDSNGRILGMSDTQQLVYLAVSTTKGSSAMRSLGQDIRSIDRITANFARRVDDTLRTAVQDIVNRGLIQVLSTEVLLVRPGTAFARMRWRDLSTGLDNETDIGAQR